MSWLASHPPTGSVLASNDREVQDSTLDKSQFAIEGYSWIVRESMQKGRCSLLEYVLHDSAHQDPCITLSARFRVRANGTHFYEAGNAHPLTCHCQQAFAFHNSVVASKLDCPLAEWAWLRQAGKLY